MINKFSGMSTKTLIEILREIINEDDCDKISLDNQIEEIEAEIDRRTDLIIKSKATKQ